MAFSFLPAWINGKRKIFTHDRIFLLISIFLQLNLALWFGHNYDMRIFMASGYLVGTGQNPYIAQDLSAVFHDFFFRGITSIGYPPPWPLVLGLIYRIVYSFTSNLLIYNLAIKIPVIAANICLAYLVASILKKLGAASAVSRKAWFFLLFNPFLLYFSSAWGQIDSMVALLSLSALVLLYVNRSIGSAILLALAFSLKPIVLPILIVTIIYITQKSIRRAISYSAAFIFCVLLFCISPFILFKWDPAPILNNWNFHFTIGGGMSFMTFFELLANSYHLPDTWWLLGLVWIPAIAIASMTLSPDISGFEDLLKKSVGMTLVFFLTRTWLSEPNIILLLPLVLILTSLRELNNLALAALWILPLVFTIFNVSFPQLLFPSMPDIMNRLLILADEYRTIRLVARTIVVIPWQVAGWWIVVTCLRRNSVPSLI